jgi:hypothetical protein
MDSESIKSFFSSVHFKDVAVFFVTVGCSGLLTQWIVQRLILKREKIHAIRNTLVKLHGDVRTLLRSYFECQSDANTFHSLMNSEPKQPQPVHPARGVPDLIWRQFQSRTEDWGRRVNEIKDRSPRVGERLRIAVSAVEGDVLALELLGCVHQSMNDAVASFVKASNIFDEGRVPDYNEYKDCKPKAEVALIER